MNKKVYLVLFLCLQAVLPSACGATERTKNEVLCRPLGQSLLMRSHTFPSDVTDKEKVQSFFSGNWKKGRNFSEKSNNFAVEQRLPIISVVLSERVCSELITAIEFEDITNELLRKSKNSSKSIELLKFEGLSEIAIQNENWSLLQTHIKNFKSKTILWPKPLNFEKADPTAKLHYLSGDDETYHFKRASLENYYTGILALKNGNTSEVVTAMINFLQFSNNYSFLPHADYIYISHNKNDLLRSALVTNSILTMDFAHQILTSDLKFTLTPDQQLDFYIISVRSLVLHTRTTTSFAQLLSPYQLDLKKQSFKISDAEPIDEKQLSLVAFEASQYNFRRWWPYDYGPYLWKYESRLNTVFWQKYSELASTKKELRKSEIGLCSAQLLHTSLGLSSKDNSRKHCTF